MKMNSELFNKVNFSIQRFITWLNAYGDVSYDYQSFYTGTLGSKAKRLYYRWPLLGTIAVAPMVLCETFLPCARRLFGLKQRFPIADAHYAMGLAFYSRVTNETKYYRQARHFLEMLEQTRCPSYEHFCWGYPFKWVTRNGSVPAGTPLITTTPYVYEAFSQVYEIDKNERWREVMHSIAEHALHDFEDVELSPEVTTCSYSPSGETGVINASAYRAFLLTHASQMFSNKRYLEVATGNLNFVLQSQRANGSWYYAVDGIRDFVDHFHTCFVLKALVKIDKLIGHAGCQRAIAKGVDYYVKNLFDEKGLPKPFSKPPRLTVYRRELYDYAECINLGVLLRGRYPQLDKVVEVTLKDLLSRWQKPDGSFRSRELYFGWDNVPMHRWAQSQVFRALCFLLHETHCQS